MNTLAHCHRAPELDGTSEARPDRRRSPDSAEWCRWSALIVVLALAWGCGTEPAPGAPSGERQSIRVDTAKVTPKTVRETVAATGSLRAVETIELRSEVAGPIESIHFTEGERVRRGELLISVEASKLEDQLTAQKAVRKAAVARADLARSTHERIATLHERGSASPDELDRATSSLREAVAGVQQLDAEIELTVERLADTEIRAPADGRISQRLVDRGDVVQVGTPLASLYTVDELEIVADIPDRVIDRVEIGQSVEARLAAFPGRVFAGEVTFVSPAVDESSRTFPVKALITNPGEALKPGSFAAVEIILQQRAERPTVPEEALVSTRQGYIVFVVKDGLALSP